MSTAWPKALRSLSPRQGRLRRGLRAFQRRRRRLLVRLRTPFVALASRLLPRSFLADRRHFALWQRRGIHALPVHYYSPVPDTRELPQALFQAESAMVGVSLDDAPQLALLDHLEARWREAWLRFPREKLEDPTRFSLANSSFPPVDAEMLYALLREGRPSRMVEVGSGHSTLLAAQAFHENAADGPAGELVAIEPFPDAKLRRALAAGLPGLTRIVERRVQEVPLDEFTRLGPGDVLFIDSSHVLRTGGDVRFEFLEVLPRLAPGVRVHVHDVFLPGEYPREWLYDNAWFFNEQYLLQAFLAFNERFRVLWASHFMATRHGERLRRAFPAFADLPHRLPASFWLERVS